MNEHFLSKYYKLDKTFRPKCCNDFGPIFAQWVDLVWDRNVLFVKEYLGYYPQFADRSEKMRLVCEQWRLIFFVWKTCSG
jgi:hypothetical protein